MMKLPMSDRENDKTKEVTQDIIEVENPNIIQNSIGVGTERPLEPYGYRKGQQYYCHAKKAAAETVANITYTYLTFDTYDTNYSYMKNENADSITIPTE